LIDTKPLHSLPGWRVARDGTIYNARGKEVQQHRPRTLHKSCAPVVYHDVKTSSGGRRTRRRSAAALLCEGWHDKGCPCAIPVGWRWDREHPFRDQRTVKNPPKPDNLRAAHERWKRKGTVL